MSAVTNPVPRSSITWWPAAAAVLFAATQLVSPPSTGTELAPILTASAFVYLGASALGRRATSWPVLLATVAVLIVVDAALPDPDPAWSSWALVSVAAALTAYGLRRGAARPASGLPLQATAMAVFSGGAIAALRTDATWAGLLVGAGLLCHTAWDVYHYRTQRVVVPSMAVFCAVLDTLLAAVVVWVTLT